MGAFNKQTKRETNDYEQTTKFLRLNLFYFLIILLTIGASILTGCNKDEPINNNKDKLITIGVKTEGIHITQMKSFDPATWLYNYNPNVYNLVFTSTSGGQSYSFPKTIQELKNGFSVSVIAGTYNITYSSIHQPNSIDPVGKLSNTLDLVINDTKTITINENITLTGVNDDALIVVDNGADMAWLGDHSYYPSQGWELFSSYGSPIETGQGTNQTRYGYINIEGSTLISWTKSSGTIYTGIIPNVQKNNIYHIVEGVGGNLTITTNPMLYNSVIF